MSQKKKDNTLITPSWRLEEVISRRLEVHLRVVEAVVEMLDQGATIPFIARYRKERTRDLEVSKLREIQDQMEELRAVVQKMISIYNAICKVNKMSEGLGHTIRDCQTMVELEDVYAPYKPGSKGTLAARARALGVEPLANAILKGSGSSLQYVKPNVKGVSTREEVETSVVHILCDIIHKDKEVLSLVRDICVNKAISLECKQAPKPKDVAKLNAKQRNAQQTASKYENYFEFKNSLHHIKAHQVLAINRGEELKILTVKVVIPDNLRERFRVLCRRKFIHGRTDSSAQYLIMKAIDDCWSRLVVSQISRYVRSSLTKDAVKSSIEVFTSNLKHLLLTAPVKGHVILGIDPGFKNGCKCAVISPIGKIIHTEVLYLHSSHREADRLLDVIKTHRCELLAIGNGTACRETETLVANLIQKYKLKVKYCIVDECGASIYSCSDEAKKEMPNLDPSLRGGVSIARRLQDPMAELVKINPKNIGVGQYQHDLPEKQLQTALDSVVEECVSFVGVDLNTCSEPLLRRIAGLNVKKAQNIIQWRESRGSFMNREQLKFVKGIGDKTYEQCIGFLQVRLRKDVLVIDDSDDDDVCIIDEPGSSGKRKLSSKPAAKVKKRRRSSQFDPNPLDATWIHPESYELTEKLMKRIGVIPDCLGQNTFIEKVKDFSKTTDNKTLASDYQCGEQTIDLIIKALQRSINFDLREHEYDKPLFKQNVCDFNSLKTGAKLTGKISNVTHFGAFVDIGVGTNGLIHTSNMRGHRVALGNKVEVEVMSVESERKRIGLRLLKII
ncbi:hypothetical protein FSP39_025197 [Pinctada imbricata]|uniref:S1 motif domain-containing protein n=1 Tax=Pinctada imbricata TaxID=66713 RepID=A0AA88Y8F3_PINIB|nr:hypothetical protein FSP39_025197 [Pinctada imbricata]